MEWIIIGEAVGLSAIFGTAVWALKKNHEKELEKVLDDRSEMTLNVRNFYWKHLADFQRRLISTEAELDLTRGKLKESQDDFTVLDEAYSQVVGERNRMIAKNGILHKLFFEHTGKTAVVEDIEQMEEKQA
jgi:hypothetical protein